MEFIVFYIKTAQNFPLSPMVKCPTFPSCPLKSYDINMFGKLGTQTTDLEACLISIFWTSGRNSKCFTSKQLRIFLWVQWCNVRQPQVVPLNLKPKHVWQARDPNRLPWHLPVYKPVDAILSVLHQNNSKLSTSGPSSQGLWFKSPDVKHVLVVTFKGTTWGCRTLYHWTQTWGCRTLYHWTQRKILSCFDVNHFEFCPLVQKIRQTPRSAVRVPSLPIMYWS